MLFLLIICVVFYNSVSLGNVNSVEPEVSSSSFRPRKENSHESHLISLLLNPDSLFPYTRGMCPFVNRDTSLGSEKIHFFSFSIKKMTERFLESFFSHPSSPSSD